MPKVSYTHLFTRRTKPFFFARIGSNGVSTPPFASCKLIPLPVRTGREPRHGPRASKGEKLIRGEICGDHFLGNPSCSFSCLPDVRLEAVARPSAPPLHEGGVLVLRPKSAGTSKSQRMGAQVTAGKVQALGRPFNHACIAARGTGRSSFERNRISSASDPP